MSKTINVYLPAYNEKHCEILQALAAGLPNCKTLALGNYKHSDIAVIFGAYKWAFSKTKPKKKILELHKGKSLLMVESGFFKRGEYYQVGFGGFAGNAYFNNMNPDDKRMFMFDGLIKPWRKPGSVVYVCGQLQRDTQVQHTDHYAWCQRTVKELVKLGYKVKFRPHPRELNYSVYGIDKKCRHVGPIETAFNDALCFVTFNSTSCVDAIINGVPAICMDGGSIGFNFCDNELTAIKDLQRPDRSQFFKQLSYSQWTKEEMRAGLPWQHLND